MHLATTHYRGRVMLNDSDSRLACEAISHSALMVQHAQQEVAWEQRRWCVLLKPRLYIDGDQWCALYGENIQDGVCGFGDTPGKAMEAFDSAFNASLAPPTTEDE